MQHFGASDGKIVCWLIKYVYTVDYLLLQFNGKINNLWGCKLTKVHQSCTSKLIMIVIRRTRTSHIPLTIRNVL